MGSTMVRAGRVVATSAAALVAVAGLEWALVASARAQWAAVLAPGPARPDEAVGAVLAAAAVLVAAWLGATGLASLLAHVPGRVGRHLDAWSRARSPAIVRRVATVLLGASVGGVLAPGSAAGSPPPVAGPGFAVTASAGAPTAAAPVPDDRPGFAPTGQDDGVPSAGRSTPEPGPGWVPQRPVVRPQPAPDLVAGHPRRSSPGEVVVLRGDTLWSIASRHLGAGASDAEVAREWPRWYAANRAVVGDDANLLLPGQVLTVPATPAVAR